MPISWNRSLEQREVAVFQKIQSSDERLGGALERRQLDRENRLRGRENHGERIAVLVVKVQFVMKVGTVGPPRLPDITDDFPLYDAAARPQPLRETPEVRVIRAVSTVVQEHDEVSITVSPSRERHDTVSGRLHPRSASVVPYSQCAAGVVAFARRCWFIAAGCMRQLLESAAGPTNWT